MPDVDSTSRLKAVAHWLRRRCENVIVALLAIMFATFIVQIFARYVLNRPVGWSEEVIISAWLWTVLWGAAFVVSEAEEIRFDLVYSNLSRRLRRVLTVITGLTLVTLYGLSLPASWSYVSFVKVERSAYLHVPLNWLYSIYLIFLVACIGRYCWLIVAAIRGTGPAQTDSSKLGD